jgi:cytochrome c biogenesis protein CcmG/thiol:disulfide interchange protein DsbE
MNAAQRLRRRLLIALDVALLIVVLVLLYRRALPQAAAALNLGSGREPAPTFTLATLDGDSLALESLRGQVVLVNFWASWCLPCLDELPLLQRAVDEPAGAFRVLAVGFRNLPSDDADWLAEHDITIPSLQDPDFEVARAYGVRAIPQTFFIDGDGVIRDRVFGITTDAALREPLDALLATR